MDARQGDGGGDAPASQRELPRAPEPAAALVNWDGLAAVGEALLVATGAPPAIAARALPSLLDRLTRSHRLLEEIAADADGVIAGDPLAARRMADRMATIAASCPGLAGSTARARKLVERADAASAPDGLDTDALDSDALDTDGRDTDVRDTDVRDTDGRTLSFDALVRLGTAASLATRTRPAAALDTALDLLFGLALQTSAADRLARGLAAGGAPGVAGALNELRLLGHPVAAPAPMHTMSGGPVGIPGLPGGGLPGGGLPGGGLPGGGTPGWGRPGGPDDLPGLVHDILDRVRDRRRWDPERWDEAPTWREIVGLDPIEQIDRAELARVRCLLAMTAALTLRQEPPPPRPARVVWSDSITGITARGACPGDQIVIHGAGFGAPSAARGVMLPTADGCRPFPVPPSDWSGEAITVTLPTGVSSGPVGLVDMTYANEYDAWAARMNALTTSILENARCSRSKAPDVAYVLPFGECAPATPVNRLRAGLPVVRSFMANGMQLTVVEPGQPLRLEWDLANADHFHLTRLSGSGPGFAGGASVDDPPGALYDLGPFAEKVPVTANYELSAVGPCGTVTAGVKVLLRKVPQLAITGIEVTQGVQTFRDPGAPPNSIPLVANKDTIVRVYVAVENLGDFGPHGVPGEVDVSGEVRLNGAYPSITLPPINTLGTARARPDALIDRQSGDHTLNFRIPAAAASSALYGSLRVTVWTDDEVESAPSGFTVRPTAVATQPVAWAGKAPYRVRYVRISTGSGAALSDAEARAAVIRGFDLLATPATDILPARLATWHTSVDIDTRDGVETLLDHIDDQHDCTFSEWLLPWEDECPDDDGATWLGILPRQGDPAGLAQGYRVFNTSRNTAIVDRTNTIIAHELGHTLKLNHVNPDVGCGVTPDEDGSFDTLPDGGAIREGDAFDPTAGSVVRGYGFLHDFMSYACTRWVSRTNWMRVFGKF